MSGEDAASYRRFWVAFAAWLVVSSCVAGCVLTFLTAPPLATFDLLEYVPRVVSLSSVRVLAPGSVCFSMLLALVTWAHPLSSELVRAEFRALALRIVVATPLAYPVALSLAILTSFSITSGAYDVTWRAAWSGMRETLVASDALFGAIGTLSLVSLFMVLSSLLMPRLSSSPWGLSRKLVVAGGAFAVVFGIVMTTIPIAVRNARALSE